MSSLESLANPDYRPPHGPACTVAVILRTADEETAELFTAALANAYAPSSAIAKAMTDRGHKISANVLQRHRRGDCRCSE